jgi:hypothetical protein
MIVAYIDYSPATNFFRVKDVAKFKEWAELFGELEVVEDDAGRVGLVSENENGWWPSKDYEELSEDEDEEEAIFQDVAKHLQDGSVAIFNDFDNVRALNSKGEQIRIQLRDIFEHAKVLGSEITAMLWE